MKKNFNVPLCLGNEQPHADTDRKGEGAIYESGRKVQIEEHGGSSVAEHQLKALLGMRSGGCLPSSDTQDGVDEESDGTGSH